MGSCPSVPIDVFTAFFVLEMRKNLFQLVAKVVRKAEKCYHFKIGDFDTNTKSG